LHKTERWTPEYISVGFVAKGCGVSNATVLRWIRAGKLLAFRLPGGHYRIDRKNLDEFLTENKLPMPER
jgi:excisionase family DNA binding protein